jgi:DNA-binding NarL/FixJ family response regulator
LQILVADDNEAIRNAICSILRSRSNLEVCGEAANGDEAVEKSRRLKPDLVILDISMPQGGLNLAKQIRKLLPEVPILIVSVYEGLELMAQVEAAGVQGFLRKDQAGRLLLKAVDALVRGEAFFPA